ncbi:MBL fold metallo-hydrolase RNA specificity domain-containing protein [Kitasatospora purpeofusca]|uniref:MBL fold metallo-hydrolase RNA specificity domain-containing protein n=1 Tax=Kitasatospora purpeofusca TaxID=67352 RepID=UPI00381C4A0D
MTTNGSAAPPKPPRPGLLTFPGGVGTVTGSKLLLETLVSTLVSALVSAPGMATGGRVVHHRPRLLPDPRNTVIVVGCAPPVPGPAIWWTARRCRRRTAPASRSRAEVVDVPAFSAHAAASEVIDWLRAAPPPSATYLVHGEPEGSRELRDRIDRELGWTAVVPRSSERVLVH